jgi:hypothetical protein
MASSRVTFTFTSSLNSFLLPFLLRYFLAVNVHHFISFTLLSNFGSPYSDTLYFSSECGHVPSTVLNGPLKLAG